MYGLSKESLSCLIKAILLLLIVVWSTNAHSQQPPQAPEIQARQDTKGSLKAQEKPKAPVTNREPLPANVPEPVSVPQANQYEQQGKKPGDEGTEFWPPLFGYRLKVTDTLLVLFTALLFVATWRLWLATDNLVKGSDDTAKRELRAYVGTEHIGVLDNPVRGGIVVKNFGRTIATEVEVRIAGAFANTQPIANFSLGGRKCKAIHMPSEVTQWNEPVAIQGNDRALLNSGTGSVYVWGRIDYKDVFGEPHWTTFRFMTEGRPGPLDDPYFSGHGWKVQTCHEGNDAN